MTLVAAADGSALGNPGPAGWAWYVDDDCWASGGWPHGTNNMGELTAVLDLLQQTAGIEDDLRVICDSTYAIKAIREWMPGWKRRGWKKGDGKPVANVEIMKALDAAMDGRRDRVAFEWVKGHSGHPLNEAADKLANAAALAFQNGEQPAHGPGIAGRRGEHAFEVTRQPEPDADLFSLVEEPSDEDTVVALERSLLTDDVRADPAAVAALLHPDWEEIGQSGRHWSREELLAEIGPLDEALSLEVLGIDRVGDDTLLLVWRSVRGTGSTLRSSLWVKASGRWVQRFHQGTPEA
ncbi:ribonuclease HI family protein [Nocardioides euryhalodurans]|uniref:ribonuclease H n=1 Tax=Nocardioides euryhalodurans TaxID=2518370 RepID=A0A4P7GN08_9ACTN|nr:ribonuclease HI family protein [Nocardioides euryhalodurans]QBR93420.1 ribonuclease HI family protein [Nocardioides euryhalodurans]